MPLWEIFISRENKDHVVSSKLLTVPGSGLMEMEDSEVPLGETLLDRKKVVQHRPPSA